MTRTHSRSIVAACPLLLVLVTGCLRGQSVQPTVPGVYLGKPPVDNVSVPVVMTPDADLAKLPVAGAPASATPGVRLAPSLAGAPASRTPGVLLATPPPAGTPAPVTPGVRLVP